MIILGVDTISKICEVSLKIDNNFYITKINDGLIHSDRLIFLINDLLKKNNILPKNINSLVINIGPGSFTGIRVGVSFARAFAQICNINIIPIINLDMLEYIGLKINSEKKFDFVITLSDALRQEFYTKIFDLNKNIALENYKIWTINNLQIFINDLLNKNKDYKILILKNYDINNFELQSTKNIEIFNIDTKIIENTKQSFLIQFALDSKKESFQYSKIKPFYIRKTFAEENKKNI
jgi:tRNA threonylcarbamoyladenosine biosynthesis protein TsaB